MNIKDKIFVNIFKTLITLLLILGFYSSLIIGFSFDEYFHHINGLVRYNFLTSLGEFENFNFRNNQFYPGIYDTLVFTLINPISFINEKFYINYLAELMHGINFIFSSLSLLGLYLFVKKLFDNKLAIYSVGLTLLNPFYFGHMGMNPKDIIIFFSLIWFCYFFFKYCNEKDNHLRNLFLSSLFFGFGCGVRVTFLIVVFPVVIYGIIYLLYKFKDNLRFLLKRLIFHIPLFFLLVCLIIISCWPHIVIEIKNKDFINFFRLIIENSINWSQGPKIGFINGDFYEVFNTPKTYFFDLILYRLPIYSSLLVVISFVFFIIKNKSLSRYYDNFNQKFIFLIIMLSFPIVLTILLNVNIYDNLRLFLFVVPFYCIFAAKGIIIISRFDLKKIPTKIFFIFTVLLFLFSFYRFIILTPYQYTYVNYTFTKLEKSNNKFEHDYWGTSYKAIIKKIKKIILKVK